MLVFYYYHCALEHASTKVSDQNPPGQSNLSILQLAIFLEKIHGSLIFSDFLVKGNND